ncbi:uncharacterized protein ATNIH1004_003051 [Aspergillus tanneri]|uniref:Uncharacterized protein n=1 Tax=Aspergillus tanneri TaxID=1220188 RepID=A0A5M9N6Y0_9EURO|nr:uncharacterized protein ATNIH1004_003051 [Aspergillus tanneri]KAA8650367.1 hypothetical protein ATNIH1004_003051 [Aspergillus tanneri]
MILPSHLPESICLRRSNVHYNVQACVEQPGCLSRSIKRSKSVTAVHCPAEDFVEDSEPVIFLSENTQYLQKSGISSCGGPFKRVLLYDAGQDFEDGADAQGYPDNMVRGRSLMEDAGSASAKSEDEGTRLDVNLLLPQAVSQTHPNTDEKLNMHFDTKYKNVQISHWLEFVFTVSRPDARSVQKIVRAPLALRSSYALPANASLPAYSHTCDGKPICVSATESIDG